MSLKSDFPAIHHALDSEFGMYRSMRLGVAVSGGGDSLALLHALTEYFSDRPTQIIAATVNHRLRPEALSEVQFCAEIANKLKIEHQVLNWDDWDGKGNLQAQARQARYDLLTTWARHNQISNLTTAHTANDQAETVIMRLARAAGVEGLAGIPRSRNIEGVRVLRPFLSLGREQLQAYLTNRGVNWISDPSNDNRRFERVKVREALRHLEPLGLTTPVLTEVAGNLQSAKEALNWHARKEAQDMVTLDKGDVVIERKKFCALPKETARRILACILRWIGGSDYTPRRDSITQVLEAIDAKYASTLNGCAVQHDDTQVRVFREYQAVKNVRSAAHETWDRRWRISGTKSPPKNATIRALGADGVRQSLNVPIATQPRAALIANPSLWLHEELLADPWTASSQPWNLQLISTPDLFSTSILD
ncbi:MAG: tRNA lysidine(34) synthetase TilS [Aestuariivita sp.]|nr:tRNA lysidine(34) synthetase TilS [Aestuariivita sp.]MCY4203493.1 tRNA lysidine(34) synthetase TilS [Aestuariivita sp.]